MFAFQWREFSPHLSSAHRLLQCYHSQWEIGDSAIPREFPLSPHHYRAISQWESSLEWRHAATLHITVEKICISFLPILLWKHALSSSIMTLWSPYPPSLVKWNQLLKKTGLWPPLYPLTSTNHREELMITLYNYSSRLSIIILDWHWANSGGVGVEPRRSFKLISLKRADATSLSRRCNFAPWDKGQCPHGALLHAVPGCCKCSQQLRAIRHCWKHLQHSGTMGTLSLVSRSKVASSGPTLRCCTIDTFTHKGRRFSDIISCVI